MIKLRSVFCWSVCAIHFFLIAGFRSAYAAQQWVDFGRPAGDQQPLRSGFSDPSVRRVSASIDGMWIDRPEAIPRASSIMSEADDDRGPQLDETFFDRVDIPDFSHMLEVGDPQIPVKNYMIEIPAGMRVTVEFNAILSTTISNLNVVPAQESPADVYPEPAPAPFTVNETVYASNDLFPSNNIVRIEYIDVRDKHFVSVLVAPLQVSPSEKTAEVTYEYELLISGNGSSLQPQSSIEATDAALPIYMVLTDDAYASNAALLNLIEWKKRKGYDTRLVKTSNINGNGAPTAENIIAYMRGLSASNYPDYLLIVGGHDATTGVAGSYFNTSTSTYYGYTDLDIACRTSSDYFADLYFGRLPATSSGEVTTMINKVLAMDRTPPNSSMYQKVVVAGQIQDSNSGGNNQADRLFCETADSVASYFELDTGGVNYTCTRAIVNPNGMTASGTWNSSSILWYGSDQIGTRIYNSFVSVATAQSRITTQVNAGIALLQHRDHGYVSGGGWADPFYYYTHVAALSNGSNTPVIFSINCNSGMYNFPNNFAKNWLINDNGGAYAVFAPVDTSYSWHNDWLTHGFYAAFLDDYVSGHNASVSPNWTKNLPSPSGNYGAAGSSKRLGEILNFGKLYHYEKYYANEATYRLFHLFGDPESFLRIKTPQTLTVSHASESFGTTQTITVHVNQADTTVCLYSSSLGIHEVATPSAGVATFSNVAVSGNDTAYITVTGPEARPYEGTISLYSGDSVFSFTAFALNGSVQLRWIDPKLCGRSRSDVIIRASTSDYPADSGSGRLVYAGTDQKFLDAGLTDGVQQYYSIWATDDGVNYIQPQ